MEPATVAQTQAEEVVRGDSVGGGLTTNYQSLSLSQPIVVCRRLFTGIREAYNPYDHPSVAGHRETMTGSYRIVYCSVKSRFETAVITAYLTPEQWRDAGGEITVDNIIFIGQDVEHTANVKLTHTMTLTESTPTVAIRFMVDSYEKTKANKQYRSFQVEFSLRTATRRIILTHQTDDSDKLIVLSKATRYSAHHFESNNRNSNRGWMEALEICENDAHGEDAKKRVWGCPLDQDLDAFKLDFRRKQDAEDARAEMQQQIRLNQVQGIQ